MATTNLRFRIIGDDDASGAFLKVAAASKLLNSTFSDLGSNTLGLSKLIGGAGLIPMVAGATAAITELGTSMAAGALAGGVFGISAVGIAADMVKAQKAIGVTDAALGKLTPGTKDYAAKLAQLHEQQKAFTQDFGKAGPAFDKMKSSFEGFKKATAGVTTDVMAKGFSLISTVLPKLVPVSNAAGKAIGGLLDDLSNWTKSSSFTAVIKWLKDSGPAAITHFGHVIGNTVDALGGIFANFVGPGDNAAKSLDRLTKRFAAWGHSKGASDSVNKFLAYVSSNGGKISNVLSKLAQTLPKVASALGGLGSANLTAISMFLNLLASMPQGVFDVVVKGLFGIAVASKAVAIAAGVNALITGMAGAVGLLGKAAIGTRIELGLLWAMEKVGAAVTALVTAAQWALNVAMDANPIGLVVLAIAALVAGMIIAYKHSATFRAIVQGAFHAVSAAAQAAFNWIKGHWKLLLAIIVGPVGLAAFAVIKHWGAIKAGAVNVWNAIKSTFGKVAGIIIAPFRAAASAVAGIWDRMRGFVVAYVSFMSSLPGKILHAIGNLGGLLVGAGKALVQGLINGVESMAGSLLSKISGLAHKVSSAFKNPLGIFSPSRVFKQHGRDLMEGLVQGIEQGFVRVTTALGKVTAYVKAQAGKLQGLLSARSQFASGFQAFTTSVFSTDLSKTTTDASGADVTTKATVADMIAYQRQQRAKAARLRADVRRLHGLGLSDALIRQLQGAGESGLAQIHTLAGGSKADIRSLNKLDSQTRRDLQGAGNIAGGQLFNQQIARTRNNEDLAERIARKLRGVLHDAGKGEVMEITDANGQWIIKAIRKQKRTHGQAGAKGVAV